MSILKETFTLANGVEIHKVGLGTWQSAPNDAYRATKFALENGYYHVDTAYVYGNQEEVGRGVKDSGLDRKDVFITSKIPAEWKSYEESVRAIDESLEQLGVDYIDLMLIHAPRPWSEMHERPIVNHYYDENAEMWRALEDAYEAGKLRAIGVSNFSVDDLEHLLEKARITPMVNQIIYHIGNTNPEVLAFCEKHNILVEGYSPIATGRLLGDEGIQKMADKYGNSIPQICIRYLLEKNILPLPKSVHEEYILQNGQVDFTIEPEDVAYLDSL
ncbi:aldo/keto reductase [Streptococcus rifensis]